MAPDISWGPTFGKKRRGEIALWRPGAKVLFPHALLAESGCPWKYLGGPNIFLGDPKIIFGNLPLRSTPGRRPRRARNVDVEIGAARLSQRRRFLPQLVTCSGIMDPTLGHQESMIPKSGIKVGSAIPKMGFRGIKNPSLGIMDPTSGIADPTSGIMDPTLGHQESMIPESGITVGSAIPKMGFNGSH